MFENKNSIFKKPGVSTVTFIVTLNYSNSPIGKPSHSSVQDCMPNDFSYTGLFSIYSISSNILQSQHKISAEPHLTFCVPPHAFPVERIKTNPHISFATTQIVSGGLHLANQLNPTHNSRDPWRWQVSHFIAYPPISISRPTPLQTRFAPCFSVTHISIVIAVQFQWIFTDKLANQL